MTIRTFVLRMVPLSRPFTDEDGKVRPSRTSVDCSDLKTNIDDCANRHEWKKLYSEEDKAQEDKKRKKKAKSDSAI